MKQIPIVLQNFIWLRSRSFLLFRRRPFRNLVLAFATDDCVYYWRLEARGVWVQRRDQRVPVARPGQAVIPNGLSSQGGFI